MNLLRTTADYSQHQIIRFISRRGKDDGRLFKYHRSCTICGQEDDLIFFVKISHIPVLPGIRIIVQIIKEKQIGRIAVRLQLRHADGRVFQNHQAFLRFLIIDCSLAAGESRVRTGHRNSPSKHRGYGQQHWEKN